MVIPNEIAITPGIEAADGATTYIALDELFDPTWSTVDYSQTTPPTISRIESSNGFGITYDEVAKTWVYDVPEAGFTLDTLTIYSLDENGVEYVANEVTTKIFDVNNTIVAAEGLPTLVDGTNGEISYFINPDAESVADTLSSRNFEPTDFTDAQALIDQSIGRDVNLLGGYVLGEDLVINESELRALVVSTDGDPLTFGEFDLAGLRDTFIYDEVAGTYTFTEINWDSVAEKGFIQFDFRVSDGTGASAFNDGVQFQINLYERQTEPVNSAPELTGSQSGLEMLEDRLLTLSSETLLEGFTDADGDTLSVTNLQVENGSIQSGESGFTLTPDANFNGELTLTYDVIDGNGGVTAATRTIDVISVNDAPELTGSQSSLVVDEGGLIELSESVLLEGITDAEGDTLTVSNFQTVNPDAGTVEYLGGSYVYTPPADFNGEVNVTYTVTDSFGEAITVERTIEVVSDSPAIQAGVEGVDYVYGQEQINDNNNWGRRGFTENGAGDYWVKVKNGSDDLIGNGQEVALVLGKSSIIDKGINETADILTGLSNGEVVASNSFTSYDGTFVYASFERETIQGLLDSGESLHLARVDAETGDQLGFRQSFDETQIYSDFERNFGNSLSAQNDFAYGDILAETIAPVDPII